MFKIARVGIHEWEEPSISGTRGSGTIFFSGCTMKCAYCQNYEISHLGKGLEVDDNELVLLMMHLQDKGVHNINLVTPNLYTERLAMVLERAKLQGLEIPIVYNTSSYETVKSLKQLDGLVDIYLPDFKYAFDELGKKYSGVPNYFETAKNAIVEMRRQQSDDVFDGEFIMQRGVIVRHLVLPGQVENSKKVLDEIANIDRNLYISVMGQYFPTEQIKKMNFSELNKTVTEQEYEQVLNHFFELELENGFMQELDSAIEDYVPNFDLEILQNTIKNLTK